MKSTDLAELTFSQEETPKAPNTMTRKWNKCLLKPPVGNKLQEVMQWSPRGHWAPAIITCLDPTGRSRAVVGPSLCSPFQSENPTTRTGSDPDLGS